MNIIGRLAQLARALPLQGRCRRFESCTAQFNLFLTRRMKKIIPAILTSDRLEFQKMLQATAGFCGYVQIDIMDGKFVPSCSITPEDLAGNKALVFSEVHLMVENPQEWIVPCRKFGAKAVIFHIEVNQDIDSIISEIQKQDMQAGLAVNPDTSASQLEEFLDKINSVLFMSVYPGFYGAPFIPEVLEKIKQFRRRFSKTIGIDGGVKMSNLREVILSGADNIYVGSAILKAQNPGRAYKEFIQLV